MSKHIDLNGVKNKIHRTILEDGLLEIMMGIYLILSGVFLNNKSLVLNYLWLPVALVLIEIIRRRLIFPRTGYAKISLSTLEIFKIFSAILIGIAALAALIALISTGLGSPVVGNWREITSYALIFFLTLSFCFIAYRFRMLRWYMHAFSMGGVFLLSKAFDMHGLVVTLGIWVTLVGVYVFVGFLRRYPVGPGQVSNHESGEEEGSYAR